MNCVEACLNPLRTDVSVFFVCLQLLKCVLRDLLEDKEVQKNLLQVHLNGTDLFITEFRELKNITRALPFRLIGHQFLNEAEANVFVACFI